MSDVDDSEDSDGDRQAALEEFTEDREIDVLRNQIDTNAESIGEITDVLERLTDQFTDLTDHLSGTDVGERSDAGPEVDVPFYQ